MVNDALKAIEASSSKSITVPQIQLNDENRVNVFRVWDCETMLQLLIDATKTVSPSRQCDGETASLANGTTISFNVYMNRKCHSQMLKC